MLYLVARNHLYTNNISRSNVGGSFAYLNADRVLRFDNGTIACISGMAIMVILCMLEKKKNIKWLREWGLQYHV